MFQLIFTIHIILCLGLVFLVLLQHGKGADMGAAFGGNTNTVFGAGGAPDFLTKLTTSIAVAFMITSVILVRSYQMRTKEAVGGVDPLSGSVMEGVAAPTAERAASPEAPAGNTNAGQGVAEPKAGTATEGAPVSGETKAAAPAAVSPAAVSPDAVSPDATEKAPEAKAPAEPAAAVSADAPASAAPATETKTEAKSETPAVDTASQAANP